MMGASWLQRTFAFTPFVLAWLCLMLIGWVGLQLAQKPYDGIDWSLVTGIVETAQGPAAGLLQPGDQIVAVDGVRNHDVLLYHGKRSGDTIEYRIQRGGATLPVTVRLGSPSWSTLLMRLVPLLIALTFWGVSVVVLAFKPVGQQSWLFLLFCQAFAVALAAGALSAFGPLWVIALFHMMSWWVGPLTFDLHCHFPMLSRSRRIQLLRIGGYLIAALGSLLSLIWSPLLIASIPWLAALRLGWLAIWLGGAVLLLVRTYSRSSSPEIRRQIGLVALGGCVALVPFFTLLLLPYALVQQPIVPEEITFLLLLAIPLTYGYAILNYRLINVDRYVSRAAAYALVFTLLVGIYLVVNMALIWLVPARVWHQQTANLVIALVLAAVAGLLYRRLTRVVSYIFYGGTYDYRSAVQFVSQTLAQPGDRDSLAQTLCEGLKTVLQLESIRLLLPDGDVFRLAAWIGGPERPLRLEASGPICRHFTAQPQPIDARRLQSALAGAATGEAERQLLGEQGALWVALAVPGQLLGLCILGPKLGQGVFDATDLEIIQVVTRFANDALQNAQLIEQLQQRAIERERLHQQILRAREEERKHVARELHDQIIQALVGLNYHLSQVRARLGADVGDHVAWLQGAVRQTLDDVRRICSDLRPPALDNLGLVPAIRSRLRDLEQQSTLEVQLKLEGDPQQRVAEDVALCLFRVMQEALVNVQKHASAHTVEVCLSLQPSEICLVVQDDGRGFSVPAQLGQLMQDQHFGLIGLRERLELVHGALSVSSTLGQGTRIVARVPLTANTSSNGKGAFHD